MLRNDHPIQSDRPIHEPTADRLRPWLLLLVGFGTQPEFFTTNEDTSGFCCANPTFPERFLSVH